MNEELIDKYLQGTINDLEQEHLNNALENDQQLQQVLQIRTAIKTGIQDFYKQEIKEEFAQWDEEFSQTKTRNIQLRRPQLIFGVAASLAVLLISLFLWFSISSNTPDTLYTAYYQKYPNYVESITRSGSENTSQTSAFRAYEASNFPKAIKAFSSLKQQEQTSTDITFYLALSYLGNQSYAEAITEFEEFLQNPSPEFREAAQWYLALTYLKTNNIEQSRQLLEGIAQTEGDYTNKSKKLLNDL